MGENTTTNVKRTIKRESKVDEKEKYVIDQLASKEWLLVQNLKESGDDHVWLIRPNGTDPAMIPEKTIKKMRDKGIIRPFILSEEFGKQSKYNRGFRLTEMGERERRKIYD